MIKAHTLDDCLNTLEDMIHEVTREATHTVNEADRRDLLAKRQALVEARTRMVGGGPNRQWARTSLPLVI